MSPHDYERACEIFDELWALPEHDRAERLDSLCKGDEALEARVRGMLNHLVAADREEFLTGVSSSAESCATLRPTLLSSAPTTAAAEPRFRPGQMIAGRYRVVVRLGTGGMGEVYRAEDLVLGQAVALKFLSKSHAADTLRHGALLAEVRLGREVAHANVCRVYDVSEADGERFITMEFIEGEDLASQMRRLERLHPQTALRVAREVCLGLAALHERGVVHRDLKPGNVMLDREGHVRIVDFGLAVTEGSAPSQVAGTLGFVAPECLRGEPPTARSDLYSLGRLLQKLFAAEDIARSGPRGSAALDAGAREIISKCLADDPANRPSSALEVARAMGWDPLEVARAAGRLPTPTEVADAPVGRPLAARLAWAALGVSIAGMALILLGHTHTSAFSRAKPLRPADLQFRARSFLDRVGYDAPPVDSAGAYRLNPAYERGPLTRPALGYWYRQSAQTMIPKLLLRQGGWRQFGTCDVTFDDPPLGPGDTFVVLDAANGNLCEFMARPTLQAAPRAGEWYAELFSAAGLNLGDFEQPTEGDSQAILDAPVHCDEWLVFERREKDEVPARVVAASLAGQAVYFRAYDATDSARQTSFALPGPQLDRYFYGGDLLLVLLILASAWLVPLNLRRGYADRSGALRLAATVFTLRMAVWVLSAHHVAGIEELGLFLMGATRALFDAAILWLFYVALEPAVRRLWPESLVSWNRLLAGRWRDPLVGSSILAGLTLGVATELVDQADILTSLWLFPERSKLTGFWPTGDAGPATIAANVLSLSEWAITFAIFGFFLLLVLRTTLRFRLLAAGAFVLVSYGLYHDYQSVPELTWVSHLLSGGALFLFFTRFGHLGLLSGVCFWLVHLFATLPLSPILSDWWSPVGYTALVVVIALAGFGFCVGTGRAAEARAQN